MVQKNFRIRGQRSLNGTRMQKQRPEQSPNRAENSERITELRKDARKQKRSASGARAEHSTPERARDFESRLRMPKLYYSETTKSPIIPGRLNTPQAHQTPISLPIYMRATCQVQNPDIPRACRVGAHGGVAGRGRAGLHANRSVRLGDNPFSYFPKHRRHVA